LPFSLPGTGKVRSPFLLDISSLVHALPPPTKIWLAFPYLRFPLFFWRSLSKRLALFFNHHFLFPTSHSNDGFLVSLCIVTVGLKPLSPLFSPSYGVSFSLFKGYTSIPLSLFFHAGHWRKVPTAFFSSPHRCAPVLPPLFCQLMIPFFSLFSVT